MRERQASSLQRLAEDFGEYRQAAERQSQDLRTHFEKLESQMAILIETSKIRNQEQAQTQVRHEEQIKEAKNLALELDKARGIELQKTLDAVDKIKEWIQNTDGSLKVWKAIGSGLGVLLVGALIYLFSFAWNNDRGGDAAPAKRNTPSHYEDRDR